MARVGVHAPRAARARRARRSRRSAPRTTPDPRDGTPPAGGAHRSVAGCPLSVCRNSYVHSSVRRFILHGFWIVAALCHATQYTQLDRTACTDALCRIGSHMCDVREILGPFLTKPNAAVFLCSRSRHPWHLRLALGPTIHIAIKYCRRLPPKAHVPHSPLLPGPWLPTRMHCAAACQRQGATVCFSLARARRHCLALALVRSGARGSSAATCRERARSSPPATVPAWQEAARRPPGRARMARPSLSRRRRSPGVFTPGSRALSSSRSR